MENNENNQSGNEQSAQSDIRKEVQNLRTALHLTIIIIAISTFVLNFYLFRQWLRIHRQVREMEVFVEDYKNVCAPVMTDFAMQLQEFAKTDKEFAGILIKHLNRPGAPVVRTKNSN
jgi:hypothetical protein